MTQREIAQRIVLINAQAMGWVAPDYPESLDSLVADAERWSARWSGNHWHHGYAGDECVFKQKEDGNE